MKKVFLLMAVLALAACKKTSDDVDVANCKEAKVVNGEIVYDCGSDNDQVAIDTQNAPQKLQFE